MPEPPAHGSMALLRYARYGMMVPHARSAFGWCALLVLVGLAACKKEGGTPGFLYLNSPEVRTIDGTTLLSSAITDLWVFVDDEPVGVWQAGRRIPVLASGNVQLKVIAGVRRNGVADDRIQYPFYATFAQDITLEPGQDVNVQPVFNYFEDQPYFARFDQLGTSMPFLFNEGDTAFTYTNASAELIQGSYSALGALDAAHPTFLALCDPAEPLPSGGQTTFLEFDFRSDMRVLVGVRFYSGGQLYDVPYVFLAPTGSGTDLPVKHIYIDVGSAWVPASSIDRKFYFYAQLENGATSGRLVLDNIRLID